MAVRPYTAPQGDVHHPANFISYEDSKNQAIPGVWPGFCSYCSTVWETEAHLCNSRGVGVRALLAL